ncbi:MAG: alpha amylase C-terminal domain-containing protein [Akkermansia sp.]
MRRPPIPGLVMSDGWLTPYTRQIKDRQKMFDLRIKRIRKRYGSLSQCALGYRYFGFNRDEETKEWVYREWAPGARQLFLIGDFNNWDRSSHPLTRNDLGIWEIRLSKDTLKHEQHVKVHVIGADGRGVDRIPAWISRAVQDSSTYDFSGQIWAPECPFEWENAEFDPSLIVSPLIYEAHTGMCGEEERIHSYREFADNVLPKIADLGYNTIQLMAVQEHPYYGSFGYHVSSFFAPSSRFGSPDDLKYLIDQAHGYKIAVLLDVVHSHSVKNEAEGLGNFDGSGGQYFLSGERGIHPDWDSYCFDYGRDEVVEFLLSNIQWWLEEFHFDGFRFDGVTSMLYFHRGHEAFDNLGAYFGPSVDHDAVSYLQLASTLIQDIKPGAIVIAEDMSGMPGMCRPIDEGGIGFTHRLSMGIPDYWIKLIKDKKDEEWSVGDIWYMLINRRYGEAHIAYCESHDQALVGDKTLAFRLMDADMYWEMDKSSQSIIVDRGVALHKMIRLISIAAGGDGWLNFMGNEFGHPEWIDFPREGNNWSYQYCRRQWSLVDNHALRYELLRNFDKAMIDLTVQKHVLASPYTNLLNIDEMNQVLAFSRNNLIFVFNWSGNKALPDYVLPAVEPGEWRVILDTDSVEFGGFGSQDNYVHHFTDKENRLSLYLLPRTAIVLERVGNATR